MMMMNQDNVYFAVIYGIAIESFLKSFLKLFLHFW